jgi:hypothetical protein
MPLASHTALKGQHWAASAATAEPALASLALQGTTAVSVAPARRCRRRLCEWRRRSSRPGVGWWDTDGMDIQRGEVRMERIRSATPAHQDKGAGLPPPAPGCKNHSPWRTRAPRHLASQRTRAVGASSRRRPAWCSLHYPGRWTPAPSGPLSSRLVRTGMAPTFRKGEPRAPGARTCGSSRRAASALGGSVRPCACGRLASKPCHPS